MYLSLPYIYWAPCKNEALWQQRAGIEKLHLVFCQKEEMTSLKHRIGLSAETDTEELSSGPLKGRAVLCIYSKWPENQCQRIFKALRCDQIVSHVQGVCPHDVWGQLRGRIRPWHKSVENLPWVYVSWLILNRELIIWWAASLTGLASLEVFGSQPFLCVV